MSADEAIFYNSSFAIVIMNDWDFCSFKMKQDLNQKRPENPKPSFSSWKLGPNPESSSLKMN